MQRARNFLHTCPRYQAHATDIGENGGFLHTVYSALFSIFEEGTTPKAS